MKVLMTGGTGFVGTQLTSRLIQDGHEMTILTRSLRGAKGSSPGISYLEGDPNKKGPWQDAIKNHDVVINLAGASIYAKWTEEHKKAIRESRVLTTRNIVEGIPSRSEKPFILFSTSAVGYYGFCGDEELVEDSPPGNDFLARIAKEWEGEALKAKAKGARVVITRFGIVMGEKGGALSQMIPLFKKYIGGPIGSGKQWFSWVHIKVSLLTPTLNPWIIQLEWEIPLLLRRGFVIGVPKDGDLSRPVVSGRADRIFEHNAE